MKIIVVKLIRNFNVYYLAKSNLENLINDIRIRIKKIDSLTRY